jgi:hypothetical protein
MNIVHYIPVLTTLFSAYFLREIFSHYLQKRQAVYLLWWSIGVLTFGLGTLSESINTIAGWSEYNFRFWYIMGALLGGFPLAQGTVYLLLKKKTADTLSFIFVSIIIAASIAVIFSPVDSSLAGDGRLSGKVLVWQWSRYFSPLINTYSFIFLFGGAIFSALQYRKQRADTRFLGNVYIAVGALLPGIGGSFTRFGFVEVLYVTEFLGLLAIYYGYRTIRRDVSISIHQRQTSPS